MLFAHQLDPKGGFDHEQLTMLLDEDIDVDAFAAAWQHVVQRHPMLRTQIVAASDGTATQETLAQFTLPLVRADWSDVFDAAARIREFLVDDRADAFDFAAGPPLRLFVARLDPDRFWACWSFHHILLDGRSFGVVLKDVFAAYDALKRGEAPALVLPAPPPPFFDFVSWLNTKRFSASAPFFQQLLRGKDAPTPLPPLPPPSPSTTMTPTKASRYAETSTTLPQALLTALLARAAETETTVGTLVQAAWALVLQRMTGDDDVIFGATRAGRNTTDDAGRAAPGLERAALDGMVGLFINTLPVRAKLDDQEPVATFLRGLRAQSQALRAHEHTPLVDVLGQSDVPRGTPLFHTLLMFENQELNASLRAHDPRFAKRHFHYEEQPTFPLNVTVFQREHDVEVRILFDRTRFAERGISALHRHLAQVLQELCVRQTLGEVQLLDDDTRARVLFGRKNATTRAADTTSLIHELFEREVDRRVAAGSADDDAVVCGDVDAPQRLSFRALEARANQLAQVLIARGARPGTFVGILLERGLDLVVALLAAAKTGAAYVPLDPDYPVDRLAFMLTDTAAPVVVSQRALLHLLPPGAAVVAVDVDAAVVAAAADVRPARTASASDVCYTIFTSGSTGTPKGVVLTHEAVVNTLEWVNREFSFSPADRLLFVTSVCFDLSVFDVFGALGAGASIHIATTPQLKDPDALVALVQSGTITVWDSAPAALSRLVPFFAPLTASSRARHARLRLVMQSGDWIPVGLPDQLRAVFPALQIKSLGGATEAAIWSNFFDIKAVDPAWTSIPYGAPIQNSHYHVLDRRLQPVPDGVTGDLYIGGACLAQGYLNREELTRERFIRDPFAAAAIVAGVERPGHGTLYKTGDLARYYDVDDDHALAGELEFCGRADFQVKIRGFRVELGEVDAVISRMPGVREVLSVAKEDASKQKVLVSYVVPRPSDSSGEAGAVVDVDAVRAHVAALVPEFMVPTHVVLMPDGLPVSVNGKVDRKALPDPLAQASTRAQRAPRTDTEAAVVRVFGDVLGRSAVSVDDHFFRLGGHSLLATLLVARIQTQLGVALPLSLLFSAPTPEALARAIDERAAPASSTTTSAQTASTASTTTASTSTATTANALSSLIVLNEPAEATAPPVFFIAGIGGHVFTFTSLASALGPGVPCYGFRAIGSEGGEIPKERVEDIAAAYLDELAARGLLRAGLVLCGYSFGGFVAFALAERLIARGLPPALLVFFDVLAPGYPRRLPFAERALLHTEAFLQRDLAGKVDYVEERVQNVRRRLLMKLGRAADVAGDADVGKGVFDEQRQREMRALWGATALAQVQYRPRGPISTPALLLKATVSFDWPATRFDDPAHGWREWVRGDLSVVDVEGAHLRLFEGENPARMAEAITAAVARVRRRG